MAEDGPYSRFGQYLILHGEKADFFDAADAQGDLGHVRLSVDEADQALERAAKKICSLQCGLCPMREDDFGGCQVHCHEDVRPWQCWVAHFKKLGAGPKVKRSSL